MGDKIINETSKSKSARKLIISTQRRSPTVSLWHVVLSVLIGVVSGLVLTQAFGGKGIFPGVWFNNAASLVDPNSKNNVGNLVRNISAIPRLEQPMTLLVMGVDSNGAGTARFEGCRSDTMMVVSLNPQSNKVAVVSIPRDSRVYIPGKGVNKINAAHALGGPQLALQTVQETFSVAVDHYVVVDAEGLKKLFEALGPVELLVEKNMRYRDRAGHLNIRLEAGKQTLDAAQLEEYVRFRHDATGDIGRMERQQWFLRQASAKFRDPQILLKVPQLIQVANEYVRTDLSVDDMARVAQFLKDIKPTQVKTGTLPGEATMIAGGSYWIPDIEASQIALARALNIPRATNMVDSSAVSAAEPITIGIKYPRGCKEIADGFAGILESSGYTVKYKWLTNIADCQHQQIQQNTEQADDSATAGLQKQIPDLGEWPVVLAIDQRAPVDFTLVISPDSRIAIVSPGPTQKNSRPTE